METLTRKLKMAMHQGNMSAAITIAEALYSNSQFKKAPPTSDEGAMARALISYAREYHGDLQGARCVLEPFVEERRKELIPNEDLILGVDSPESRVELLVRTARLLFYARGFERAAKILQLAIETAQSANCHYGLAVAYYRLAQVRLHQFNYYEAERCACKSIEIFYQNTIHNVENQNSLRNVNPGHKVALCKICLGTIAEKQGYLAKAKAELFTAEEALRTSFGVEAGREKQFDPLAWADLHSVLGRIYAAEGDYEKALEELSRAVNIYSSVGHTMYEARSRLMLALTIIRRLQLGIGSDQDKSTAMQQLHTVHHSMSNKLPEDTRTQHLLNTVYSQYYLFIGRASQAEKAAQLALQLARRLGSDLLLSESYRLRAETQIAQQRLQEARKNLLLAIEHAEKVKCSEQIGGALLSCALSYCSISDPNPAEVDKYLDRFNELRRLQPFENYYLDQLVQKLRRERILAPSGNGFYMTRQELQNEGLDSAVSRLILWAIRSAEGMAHGDSKAIAEILHFGNLTRTYNYIRKARVIQDGMRKM